MLLPQEMREQRSVNAVKGNLYKSIFKVHEF